MLAGVDVYRDARLFPGTLRGRNAVAMAADLALDGLTERARSWRAAKGRVYRAHRGTFLVGDHRPDLLDRTRAALAAASPAAVVGYHTAAALFGFGVVPSDGIHLVVPIGEVVSRHSGITTHETFRAIAEPALVLGVPCTPAARCVVDLARHLSRADGLSIVDAALAASACTPDDLIAELSHHIGLRGVRRARDMVAIGDPRAECRQESHLRLVLHDARLSGLVPQYPVSDEYGSVRYYLDLADPLRQIGLEYDGASHLDRDRMRSDRARHNWLESQGWRMRYFTDRDLYRRPDLIVRTVRLAIMELTTRIEIH